MVPQLLWNLSVDKYIAIISFFESRCDDTPSTSIVTVLTIFVSRYDDTLS